MKLWAYGLAPRADAEEISLKLAILATLLFSVSRRMVALILNTSVVNDSLSGRDAQQKSPYLDGLLARKPVVYESVQD